MGISYLSSNLVQGDNVVQLGKIIRKWSAEISNCILDIMGNFSILRETNPLYQETAVLLLESA